MATHKDKQSTPPQTLEPQPEGTVEKVTLSLPKKLLLITVLCTLPFLLFGLLEVGLRVCGYGYPTSLFITSENKEMLKFNPRFTWRFFPPEIARPPVWQVMHREKPENTYRIFVVGGSAAQGVPMPSVGVARILEVMLEAAYPETDFEVINAAITAVNSHVVLPVVRDCAKHEPDLFIVFMGNNEVVGPFGPGSTGGQDIPSLKSIRMHLAVQTTRSGQLMQSIGRAMRPGRPGEWRGMEMFAENHVAASDPRLQVVRSHFAQNLTDICNITAKAGVPALLCTVPVNLLDCPPFASKHRGDLSEAQLVTWQEFYNAGVAAESAGQFAAAIDAYRQAMVIDDGYADLLYRLGRCYLTTDQHDDAVQAFVLARNLDALRFRADTHINQSVRELAAAHAQSGVVLVDLDARFAEAATTPGLPGTDLFFEHVHMTFPGNYYAATALYENVTTLLPESITHGEHPVAMSLERVRHAMPVTVWDEMTMLNGILDLANRPPFTGQLDHSARLTSLLARQSELRSRLILGEAEQVEGLFLSAIDQRPDDIALRLRYGSLLNSQNRYNDMTPIFRAISDEYPDNDDAWKGLARAAVAQGNYEEARHALTQLERVSGMPAVALYEVAIAAKKTGHLDFAIECLGRALKRNPDMASAHKLKGDCLTRQGKYDEAVEAFNESIRLAPSSPVAQLSLAWAFWSAGEADKAMAALATAIELDPLHAESRQLLGLIYAQQQHYDLADKQLNLAIQLNPYEDGAYLIYVESLLQRDDYAGAARVYKMAIDKLPASGELLGELAALYLVAPEPVRDYEQAILYGERWVNLTKRQNLTALASLAVTYGEAGQFEDAIPVLDEAIAIARAVDNHNALSALATYRRAFQEGRPVSDITPPSP